MRNEDSSSQDDARYEAKAKLRMQRLGSAGSPLEQGSAEDIERRLRRKRVIGRKLTR